MSKELVEKVKRILSDNECEKYSVAAHKVIRAVLAHFAERRNITEAMMEAGRNAIEPGYELMCRNTIAAAMAAALKEMGP